MTICLSRCEDLGGQCGCRISTLSSFVVSSRRLQWSDLHWLCTTEQLKVQGLAQGPNTSRLLGLGFELLDLLHSS